MFFTAVGFILNLQDFFSNWKLTDHYIPKIKYIIFNNGKSVKNCCYAYS